jgi:hypothetical protein
MRRGPFIFAREHREFSQQKEGSSFIFYKQGPNDEADSKVVQNLGG